MVKILRDCWGGDACTIGDWHDPGWLGPIRLGVAINLILSALPLLALAIRPCRTDWRCIGSDAHRRPWPAPPRQGDDRHAAPRPLTALSWRARCPDYIHKGAAYQVKADAFGRALHREIVAGRRTGC